MRLHAPAAERNAEPILGVLRQLLPARGLVLEVASGTGQHCAHFAAALPGLRWQPTDLELEKQASIAAWCQGLDNVAAPVRLDTTQQPWPVTEADAVWCANMIHIAPPEAGAGLLRGASELLEPGAPLILYGPFRVDGEHTAPSNEAFDQSLRSRDPRWGVRDLNALEQEARARGFVLEKAVEMPANNKLLSFRRVPDLP